MSSNPPPYETHDARSYQAIPQEEDARMDGDVDPDDFKVGVTVEQSAPEIRSMFVRKVYTILFLQILGTTLVASVMRANNMALWVQENSPWVMFVPLIGTFVMLGLVMWKRHSHPLNLVFLGLFTLLESFSLGIVVSYTDEVLVLKALLLTLFTFLGLTLFTLQSKYDFSSLAPWLFSGLMILIGVGMVQLFMPYSRTLDLAYSVGGCAIFSGYILYDTSNIIRNLSPDEWVMANVALYLDVINLFISILQLLNGTSDD